MPNPLQNRTRRLALAVLAIGGATGGMAYLSACSTESGTTPTCIQDEDDAGHHVIDGGCNPHPICVDDAGSAVPIMTCCGAQTGINLAACLSGFDAICRDSKGAEIDANKCCTGIGDAGNADLDFCLRGFSAKCFDPGGSGMVVDGAKCCTGKSGNALAFCLYAYGGPLPSSASGGGGGSP